MYYRVNLGNGRHFRMSVGSRTRVSFDQSDKGNIWGVMPIPEDFDGTDYDRAQWIAEFTTDGSPGCAQIISIIPVAGGPTR